jgi:hypothetical protein
VAVNFVRLDAIEICFQVLRRRVAVQPLEQRYIDHHDNGVHPLVGNWLHLRDQIRIERRFIRPSGSLATIFSGVVTTMRRPVPATACKRFAPAGADSLKV